MEMESCSGFYFIQIVLFQGFYFIIYKEMKYRELFMK